jgi:hypothetical protein
MHKIMHILTVLSVQGTHIVGGIETLTMEVANDNGVSAVTLDQNTASVTSKELGVTDTMPLI